MVWLQAWQDKTIHVVVLIVGLAALALVLTFQDWLARHPTFLWYVRYGYLVFTLLYVGWYSLAQLSILSAPFA